MQNSPDLHRNSQLCTDTLLFRVYSIAGDSGVFTTDPLVIVPNVAFVRLCRPGVVLIIPIVCACSSLASDSRSEYMHTAALEKQQYGPLETGLYEDY